MGMLGAFLVLASPFVGCRLLFRPALRPSVTRWAAGDGGGLGESRAQAATAWQMLQAEADVKGDAEESSLDDRAAALLVDTALERLQPWVMPAKHFDDLPASGSMEALNAVLKEDARYITAFLSEDAQMTAVHEAFWQGELFLQSLTEEASDARREVAPESSDSDPDVEFPTADTELESESEAAPAKGTYLDDSDATPVQETMSAMEAEVAKSAPEVSGALDDSLILARQNFISTLKFGYFLRRCQQRLGLERMLRGQDAGGLDQLLAKLPADDVVELTRIATREAALAVEHRATCMFGSLRELFDPRNIQKVDFSYRDATILTLEAAAFGAALFDAEESATQFYNLHFTDYGSRDPQPRVPQS